MQRRVVPAPSSLRARAGRLVDRLRHPRLVRELSAPTRGFTADGVIRTYANDPAGRRREAIEVGILARRGYVPPITNVHEAIWRMGGPVITIGYAREVVPAFMSPRAREVSRRLGLPVDRDDEASR